MDRDQKKYAMERVKVALNAKLTVLREACTKPCKQKPVSDGTKLEAIRESNVLLRRTAKLTTPLGEAFDFSDFENDLEELDREAFAVGEKKLRSEAGLITDVIMLGESAEAVKLIRKFCEE